jgi:hypothetical protein
MRSGIHVVCRHQGGSTKVPVKCSSNNARILLTKDHIITMDHISIGYDGGLDMFYEVLGVLQNSKRLHTMYTCMERE